MTSGQIQGAEQSPRETDRTSAQQWRDFRKLLAGQAVAQLGTAVTVVALPMLAVLQLGATPLHVGMITGAEYVAYTVLGLLAGIYVDRWSRRRAMITCDLARAVVVGMLPVLAIAGALRIWHLVLAALLIGIFSLVFDTAHQAYLPQVVSRDKLVSCNSQLQGVHSVARLAGPGAGGVIVQSLGGAVALGLNAVTYLVSLVFISNIRSVTETHRCDSDKTADRSIRREIVEGLRYIRNDKILVSFLASIVHFNTVITAQTALFVIFLLHTVDAPPAIVGFLMASMGVGAVGGAVVAQRLASWLGIGPAMVIGAVVGPLLGLLIPFTYGGIGLVLFVVGGIAVGATTTILKVVGQSYRQAVVPPHLLGRVVATIRTITWGPLPVAGLLGGVLGELLGPRLAVNIQPLRGG